MTVNDEKRIEDIAKITRGLILDKKGELNSKMLKVNAIEPTDINFDEFHDTAVDKNYSGFLKNDDVLLVDREHLNSAIVKNIPSGKFCLPQRVFKFRVDKSIILPEYLWWYLNLPLTEKRIRHIQKGKHSFTTIEDLKIIKIPVPSFEKQRQIIELYKKYTEYKKYAKIKMDLEDIHIQCMYQKILGEKVYYV